MNDPNPVAVKGQLRHTSIRTTEAFYIGSDLDYQKEQSEKISLKAEGNCLSLFLAGK